MKKRYLLAAAAAAMAVMLAACVPDGTTTGPYVDANANGTHDSGENSDCNNSTLFPDATTTLFSPGTVSPLPTAASPLVVSHVRAKAFEIQIPHVHFDQVCIIGNTIDNSPGAFHIRPYVDDMAQVMPVDITLTNSLIDRLNTKANQPVLCANEKNSPNAAPPECRGDYGINVSTGNLPSGTTSVLRAGGNKIVNVNHGVDIHNSFVDVEMNYIQPVVITEAPEPDGDHVDGIISNGGVHDLTIKNNNIDLGSLNQTAGIALFPEAGMFDHVVMDGNQLQGGKVCLSGAGSGMTNISFTNNVFVTNAGHASCGAQGFVTDWFAGATNTWSGNTDNASPANTIPQP